MFVLSDQNSIANQYLAEMRSVDSQKDRLRFRRNMERLGEIMAYEISKNLEYSEKLIETPLGNTRLNLIREEPVLCVILRAGIPFYQGFLNFFDKAESSFIGAYRGNPNLDYSFEIEMNYVASPSLENKIVILVDPMLATGKSILEACNILETYGKYKHLHIVSLIGAKPGMQYLKEALEGRFNYSLWTVALDDELNSKYYIVPGLGDAGDLAFGPKI